MKIRSSFVSNSSSCSFIVRKEGLSEWQKQIILNHIDVAEKEKDGIIRHNDDVPYFLDYLEGWFVEEREDSIYCETDVDNFPLDDFLERFGIKVEEYYHS